MDYHSRDYQYLYITFTGTKLLKILKTKQVVGWTNLKHENLHQELHSESQIYVLYTSAHIELSIAHHKTLKQNWYWYWRDTQVHLDHHKEK